MSNPTEFLFVTCQVGAEPTVKKELARLWPDLRFAYSRPGFLTFKLPVAHGWAEDFELGSVFARSYGFSLGRVLGENPAAMAEEVWRVWGDRPVDRVHVWQRDTAAPGDHGFEPSVTPLALETAAALAAARPETKHLASAAFDPRQPARIGDAVMDCVIVHPGEWWVGHHRARAVLSRWAGGIMPLELPAEAVSRAWLKMEEALRWSELPIPAGARCAEIGSAPGGATQALLARGYRVLGIDPAAMAPAVLGHPGFTHIRRRVAQVRRREFRSVRWLMADMNVTPNYTLDAVEGIVTHREVSIRGMLLTLKLFEWHLADQLPECVQRVRGWGFQHVQVRQLASHRQEVCLAALQKPFRRKPPVRPLRTGKR